jgi:ribosome biogenesis GTPase A
MPIHWYPGHMATARAEIKKALPQVDVVIEVLDARIPSSSANPLITELRGNKPCIQILNKVDLADPAVTELWMTHLREVPGIHTLAHHQKQTNLLRTLSTLARSLVNTTRARPVQAMIVGIPNVGKSTLINTLAGRTLARTSNKPAITQMQQRVQVGEIVLFDTPGFLWHKLSEVGGYRLAVTGAISDRVTDYQDLANFAAQFLMARYPTALAKAYGLTEAPTETLPLLETVGRRRGYLQRGGVIDVQRAAERLILDLREGVFGPISLERPGDPG